MKIDTFLEEYYCAIPQKMIEYQHKVLATMCPLINERSEVNEQMARDETRHGVALKGMLERYFK